MQVSISEMLTFSASGAALQNSRKFLAAVEHRICIAKLLHDLRWRMSLSSLLRHKSLLFQFGSVDSHITWNNFWGARHPYSTWPIIYNHLQPYLAQLRSSSNEKAVVF